MISVIMHGCNGRMGRVITDIIREDTEMKIVAGIDAYDGIKNEYPVFDKIENCDVSADVIIDFSNAEAVDGLLEYAVKNKTPLVLCTTGLSDGQISNVVEAGKEIPLLKSANMSLGINMMVKLIQEAAKVLARADFDIEIVEKHHNKKVDAPSGTALMLADEINNVMEECYEYVFDRSEERKAREKKELGISAVRAGSIVGDHEVIFAGIDEVIEIKHTAYSRAVFGNGAVQAARFVAGKPAGLYNMGDVIGK